MRATVVSIIIKAGKTEDEATRIVDAAIDAAFAALARNVIPDFDSAVFLNALRDAGAYPAEYRRSNHDAFLGVLVEERQIRRKAADDKIVTDKLGGVLTRKIGGKTISFVESRDERGQWSGEIVCGSQKITKEQLGRIASMELNDSKLIEERDEILAFSREGQERLEKLDPSFGERASRVYLNVSYAQKDKAKALGAKWDAYERRWYAMPDTVEKLKDFR